MNRLFLTQYSPGARLFLGMAIGDAFGARFENKSRCTINLTGEEETYRDWNRYTDDTQMAIGVAELLISGEPFTEENLAEFLITAYHRDPRSGYSQLTRSMLEKSSDPKEFLNYLSETERKQRKSDGAAMRALPIGFLKDPEEVIRYASLSALITHAHPDSLAATIGIALIAHERYHYQTSFSEIIQSLPEKIPDLTDSNSLYLNRVIASGWNPPIILQEHESYGVPYNESIILLGAVIAILAKWGETPHQALLESVRLGGDTDTTACIVLGASMIHPQGELPASLRSDLEHETFGVSYLVNTGDMLSEKFPQAGKRVLVK
jgi:ADP-ribosylglycohydrolase